MLVHLRRARDLADRDYARGLALDLLAETAGMSKYHFLRLFRATYGMTPGQYLSQRRLERSQELLRNTNLMWGLAERSPATSANPQEASCGA
ncbi:MAG TPA: AraC family transcriptional regulator [Frankiaceae bacterium]|nr:AraC family transcriptional regulator [Frankiaceae bacterium]